MVNDSEGCMVKRTLLCGSYNHDLAYILVSRLYTGRLTTNENFILVNMTKSSVKPKTINILLTMKEHNEKNVTTIKHICNVMIVYQRSKRGHRLN